MNRGAPSIRRVRCLLRHDDDTVIEREQILVRSGSRRSCRICGRPLIFGLIADPLL